MPVKITDVPTPLRVSFHPSHEVDDTLVVQMVREERADNEIGHRIRQMIEDITGDKSNLKLRRGRGDCSSGCRWR
jgi:hypothetical protein